MEEYISQSEACNLTGLTYRTISRLVYKLKKEKSQNLKEVIDNNRKSYRIRKRYLLDKYKLQPQETDETPTAEDNKPTGDDSKLVEFLKQELDKRDKAYETLNERFKEVTGTLSQTTATVQYLSQQVVEMKTLLLGESPATEGEIINKKEVVKVKPVTKTSKRTKQQKQKKPSKPKEKKRSWWGIFS